MLSIAKEIVIRWCRCLGYEIIHNSRLRPREVESHLKALFGTFDINCVLDVGANAGQYRDFLRDRVGYRDLIISFEPGKQMAELLQEKAKTDARWLIYHCALGAENTTKTFNVMHSSELSSFLLPDHSVTNLFASHNVVDHTEDVQVWALDSIMDEVCAQHDIGQKIYMKIDTQGYDLEVIKGAEKSVSKILAIQTELSCQSLYRNMPGYLEVLEVLDERGYQLSGMFPVHQDSLLRIIEFDCVLINNALVQDKNPRLMWAKDT